MLLTISMALGFLGIACLSLQNAPAWLERRPLIPLAISLSSFHVLLVALAALVLALLGKPLLGISLAIILTLGILASHFASRGGRNAFMGRTTSMDRLPKRALRLGTLNTHHGTARPEDILKWAASGDLEIVAFQEMMPRLTDRLLDLGLGELLPYRYGAPDGDQIWTRYPAVACSEDAVGYHGAKMAGATVLIDGQTLHLVSVHTCSFTPGYEAAWGESLDCVVRYVRSVQSGTVNRLVLMGDFNATLAHRSFRSLLRAGMIDARRSSRVLPMPTWPHGGMAPALLELDHVLVSTDIVVRGVRSARIADTDHRALTVELEM